MDLRERIMEAAIEAFNQNGARFTLDEISKKLNISKKTIYTVFQDKEALLYGLLEDGFEGIKKQEHSILMDDGLSTVEKIRQVVIALPDRFKQVNFKQFVTVKERYPQVFRTVAKRIESDWDQTLALFELGIEEGVIRPVPLPILKAMIEACIEHFLESDTLELMGYSYTHNLETMMDILMTGITVREEAGNGL